MAQVIKQDMLLFSAEKSSFPYKYRLYFAEKNSVLESAPIIHCFIVRTAEEFMSLEIGGVYDLTANGIVIKDVVYKELFQLSEDEYIYLLDSRDSIFYNEREKRHIGLNRADYDHSDYYYSLKTAKSLYRYTPKAINKLLYVILKCGQYVSCVLVPIALFVLYIFVCAKLSGNKGFAPFAMPVSAATTMPFLFFIMILIHALTDSLILNMPSVKYIVLQKYFLLWAGMKKDVTLKNISTKGFRIFGILSTLIFIIGLFINFH